MKTKAQTGPEHPDARERLLVAALDQFNRRGYASTTVRELCEAAGVTKPVLYYYFKSKEGLYLELMHGSYDLFESTLSELTCYQGKAVDHLIHFCVGLFNICIEEKPMVRLMYSIYFGPPQGAPFYDLDLFYDRILEAIGAIIQTGVDDGEVRNGNILDMSWIILSCLNAAIEEQLCLEEPRIDRSSISRMIRILFEGIKA